ncbi:MAG TPA: lysylphosphatidylglycerol synthase transmembrane domain-containing protein [Acidimicrobiales bacterium]|nr:lysylphosphatidylglycerol synthase transmembrane domain-containing protein [Acidimicrobiales bacterium]
MSGTASEPSGSGGAAPSERFSLGISEGGRPWRRHPADAARLAASVITVLAGLGLVAAFPGDLRAVSADLVRLARHVPDVIQVGLIGVVQLLALATPVALVAIALWWRRPIQVGVAVLGSAVAGAAVAALQNWLDRATPPSVEQGLDIRSWLTGAAFPSASYLAGLAAGITILAPSFSRRWRRTLWIWMTTLCMVRVFTAVAVPLHLLTTVALGIAVGSALLVLLGSPERRFDILALVPALARTGLVVHDLALDETSGTGLSRRLRGTVEGAPVVVKVVGRDERDADLLVRAVRALRVKGLDEDRPGWSPAAAVEHEALCSLLATGAGVRAPTTIGVSETVDGDGLIVSTDPRGRALGVVEEAELTDEVLGQAWAQLALLHGRGVAHRRPNLHHFVVDDAGDVHLRGFRAARVAADLHLLGTDVAELLMAQAARVGVERAVLGAADHMPRAELEAALPMVQPLAVSGSTRAEVKQHADKGLWDEVRDALQAHLGIESYELTKLDRISFGKLVSLFGGTVLVYVMLAFVSNWAAIRESLGDADWSQLPGLVALAFVGFVGGVWSLQGAVMVSLPFWETLQVMYAQSFLNRFTPANAGGMALRTRYLQRHGVDLTLSAASIGLTSLASGAMQLLFLVVFATWAGSSEDLGFSVPDTAAIAQVILAVLALAGGLYLLPWGRRILGKGFTSVREAAGELIGLARDPVKVVKLFGGAGFSKITTILAFTVSVHAFGVDGIAFATLAFAYMTANTVASVAPTPGGVGAIEAALVAVLTGLGVEPATALSIVLVFRLVTYWLTVPVCWFFLGLVRRNGIV